MITHEKNSYDTPVTEVVEVEVISAIMQPSPGGNENPGYDNE